MRRISPLWLLTLALAWWVLAAPDRGTWVAGGLAVLAGGALHVWLGGRGRARVRLLGLLAFVPYFLQQSVRGGLDVSRRAFTPSLPLDPGFLRYRVSLPPGMPRVVFVNTISLLPGTLCAELRGRELTVHRLAADIAGEGALRRLETKVAAVFGEQLPAAASGERGAR